MKMKSKQKTKLNKTHKQKQKFVQKKSTKKQIKFIGHIHINESTIFVAKSNMYASCILTKHFIVLQMM
jgi:hypothetical protein